MDEGPAGDVFDEIRDSCAQVATRARHVHIDDRRLESFAGELAPVLAGPAADVDDDPGHRPLGDAETTAAFVMSLDAVNFGSGYFPYIRKRPGLSGYHTVAASWRDHAAAPGALRPSALRALTPAACAGIFGQELDGGPAEELMGLFATALVDLGRFVDEVGSGRFLGVVEAAGASAAAMVGLLDRMAFFHDVHRYRGLEVKLYKRAQITVYDLAVAFDRAGPGRFGDLHRLTMFPDNLVPHVLRVQGVLRFAPALLERIEAGDDIACGSEEEVEIRACGLHAVELLVATLDRIGVRVIAGDLDGVLWRRGGGPAYKAVPRHRSRCVYY